MSEKAPLNRLKVLELIIQPVVRFLLRNGYNYKEMLEALKISVAKAGSELIEETDKKPNISRLGMLTGLDRREISRVLLESEQQTPTPEPQSILSRVTTRWEQMKRYCDKDGKPKALTYKGESSQFQKLVSEVTLDFKAGTVLFELLRNGSVRKEGNKIRLVKMTHYAERDTLEGYGILAEDLGDLVAAVRENLTNQEGEIDHAHFRTEYNNIYEEDLPIIRLWFLQESGKLHKRARTFLSLFDKDDNPNPDKKVAGKKAVFTSFSYTSPLSESEEEEDSPDLSEST